MKRGLPRKPLPPGTRFGRGVVIDGDTGETPRAVRLMCDCGTEYVARMCNLRTGNTKSCGCLKPSNGLKHHPLRSAWYAMIYRCENPATKAYPWYGGRGIRVCGRWHDFTAFATDIDRLLGPRPEGMTLDRVDNDGDYEPGNVRWADDLTQARNRRRLNRKLSDEDVLALLPRWLAGESASALAREAGVDNSVMHRRLHRAYSA